jgi:hypothetical protein
LSVVLDEPRRLDDPRIEAVEIPPGQPDEVKAPEVFVEVGARDLQGWVEQTAKAGRRAKIRCGGARVPSGAELAGFIRLCREHRVPFKATAGLHHAVRQEGQHGFLNLLAAAVFGDEEAALAEEEPGAFRLTAREFGWRDRSAGSAELSHVRGDLFVGFGSCSFFEPVEELKSMGFLPG